MTFIQAALCICHISDALHTQQATVYGAEKLGHIIYDLLICQTFMLFSEFSSFKGIIWNFYTNPTKVLLSQSSLFDFILDKLLELPIRDTFTSSLVLKSRSTTKTLP